MSNEETLRARFNEKRHPFSAWVVAPIPGSTTSFSTSWLLMVKTPAPTDDKEFPSLTDRFTIDMVDTVQHDGDTFSLINLAATRVPNPYEDDERVLPGVKKCAAFKVDVSRSWKKDDGTDIEVNLMATFRVATSIDDVSSLDLSQASRGIVIQWDTSSATFDAELAALRYLVEEKRTESRGPSRKSVMAFKMIQDFHGSEKSFFDLHTVFPQLVNPTHPSHRVPSGLQEKFRAFDADHLAAYYGLRKIPNGLYFVNGCPGAGKTEWNMVVAALIQCNKRRNMKRKHSPILFLVDINKTVDDAADRYFKLCKAVGLKLRIIRMHGWPYEMRNSQKLHIVDNSEDQADFTKSFLMTMNLIGLLRNPDKAPTLDEAAWDYFESHKGNERFAPLAEILGRMRSGEVLTNADWKVLRKRVSLLYRVVLAQADFIATTPVATYGSFPKFFKPDVIFMDEAPHARELTTLIPIAYFTPIAWIFSGDVKQTQPFVKGGDARDMTRKGLKANPFAQQLRFSTMARAATVGALNAQLLVNKRAYANLHRLPSLMFYDGQMSSGHEARYPPSASYLKGYLERLGNVEDLAENRVIVQLHASCEQTQRSSFWNPVHHRWILEQAEALLRDDQFVSITEPDTPGTIMIQTPYSTAVRQYDTQVKQWPERWRNRVQVLTVDKAQGNQADVVLLDMVRTTKVGFMDSPHRLNVAITRARQAEIVVMHPMMTFRLFRGQPVPTQYTSQLWGDAATNGRLFEL